MDAAPDLAQPFCASAERESSYMLPQLLWAPECAQATMPTGTWRETWARLRPALARLGGHN
ncbi:hypothetical protein GCM10017655_32560 [Pseudomonas turukhanskensis]|uniref:Uncharacterized protein n=2 Tax=Pseudomonas turukhanskensis TaxID=1806536 RepID=A0A9W6K8U3_9PSED|nr:hypothetical protein GCM10017655_32560 [Pseudomonas turukhanskensis]